MKSGRCTKTCLCLDNMNFKNPPTTQSNCCPFGPMTASHRKFMDACKHKCKFTQKPVWIHPSSQEVEFYFSYKFYHANNAQPPVPRLWILSGVVSCHICSFFLPTTTLRDNESQPRTLLISFLHQQSGPRKCPTTRNTTNLPSNLAHANLCITQPSHGHPASLSYANTLHWNVPTRSRYQWNPHRNMIVEPLSFAAKYLNTTINRQTITTHTRR